jgi:hypothetical protein
MELPDQKRVSLWVYLRVYFDLVEGRNSLKTK